MGSTLDYRETPLQQNNNRLNAMPAVILLSGFSINPLEIMWPCCSDICKGHMDKYLSKWRLKPLASVWPISA